MLQRQLLVQILVSLVVVGATGFAAAADKTDAKKFSPEDVAFFEKDVLPVLKANCFKCHGGEPKLRGGFRLTSREGVLKGGELGVVVNVEQPAESILVKAINYAGDGLEMPPTGTLAREKIDMLTKWVQRGLPWSSTTADYGVEAEVEHETKTADSTYWAYQPIRRLDPPAVKTHELGASSDRCVRLVEA